MRHNTTAALNAKINEVKGKIPNIANLASITALTAFENKTPNVISFNKLTVTQKLMKLKRKFLILIMINVLLLQNLIT